jgi:hypothetical protein
MESWMKAAKRKEKGREAKTRNQSKEKKGG